MIFCYLKTGNFLEFVAVRSLWGGTLISTLWSITHFWDLPIHGFHYSLIDLMSICTVGIILFLSRNYLPKLLWQSSFLIWIIPLLTTDTMSASRYQIINLPIFIYIAYVIKNRWLWWSFCLLNVIGLLFVSLKFINWNWLG